MTDRLINRENYIEKEATNYIKGIALVFMFIHHFFTFPDWYISGISYEYLKEFAIYMCGPLKICVSVFAFLTGYFYFYSKDKTIKYSIKKSTDIWLTYIVVFIILVIPAIVLGVYNLSIFNVVLELFAIRRRTMVFCWYVIFYVIAMILLPLFAKLSNKAPCFAFFATLVLPAMLKSVFSKVLVGQASAFLQIIDDLGWFTCVAIGYLFAQYGLFHEFKSIINIKNRLLGIIISLIVVAVSMIIRHLGCPDYVCAPLFVFGIMELYYNMKCKMIYKPIRIIGKYSLTMWFLHCIFFNQCKEYTQPILYFPKEPILVTIWGLLICLLVAAIIQVPINALVKIKNKALKLNSECKG